MSIKIRRPQVQRAAQPGIQGVQLPSVSRQVDPNAFGIPEIRARGAQTQGKFQQLSNLLNIGASVATAAVKIDTQLENEAEIEQLKYDKNIVRDSTNDYRTRSARFMSQSPRGKDAVKNADGKSWAETVDDFNQEQIKQASSELENDQQRAIFNSVMDPVFQSNSSRAMRHTVQQNEVFKKNTLRNEIAVDVDTAIGFKDFKPGVDANRQYIINNTAVLYQADGEEVIKSQTKTALTSMHVGIIQAYVKDKREGDASAYFESIKKSGIAQNDMTASAIAAMEDYVEKASLQKISKSAAEGITVKIPSTETGYAAMQIEEARKLYADDPIMEAAVVSRLKVLQHEKAKKDREHQSNLNSTASDSVIKAGSLSGALSAIEDLYKAENYTGSKTDEAKLKKFANDYYKPKPFDINSLPVRQAAMEIEALIDEGVKYKTRMDVIRDATGKVPASEVTRLDKYFVKGGYKNEMKQSDVRQMYIEEKGLDSKKDIELDDFLGFYSQMRSSLTGVGQVNDEIKMRELVKKTIAHRSQTVYLNDPAFFGGGLKTTTLAEAEREGRKFLTENQAQSARSNLTALGLPSTGNLGFKLLEYQNGLPPTGEFQSREKWEESADKLLRSKNITPNSQMMQAYYLLESGAITRPQFRAAINANSAVNRVAEPGITGF